MQNKCSKNLISFFYKSTRFSKFFNFRSSERNSFKVKCNHAMPLINIKFMTTLLV